MSCNMQTRLQVMHGAALCNAHYKRLCACPAPSFNSTAAKVSASSLRSTTLVWKMIFVPPSRHISVLSVSPGNTCFAKRACKHTAESVRMQAATSAKQVWHRLQDMTRCSMSMW